MKSPNTAAKREKLQRPLGVGTRMLEMQSGRIEDGVCVILEAACSKRVETWHFMLKQLEGEGTAEDILENILVEARHQMIEAEEDFAVFIGGIFGMKQNRQ